jgi:hypothetical protein
MLRACLSGASGLATLTLGLKVLPRTNALAYLPVLKVAKRKNGYPLPSLVDVHQKKMSFRLLVPSIKRRLNDYYKSSISLTKVFIKIINHIS